VTRKNFEWARGRIGRLTIRKVALFLMKLIGDAWPEAMVKSASYLVLPGPVVCASH
jgi:hypothetical protein